MARYSFERVDKAMNDFAKGVVKQARGNLTREKANASRTLYASIRFKIKNNVLDFFMEYYGAFLDKGVSGTGQLWLSKNKKMPVPYNKSEAKPEFSFKPSKRAIGGNLKNWLTIKGIDLKAEFPIRRSIHARGIRPRRFFTNAFNQQYDKFDEVINRAVTNDINQHIDKILRN
jgi:hypothetical protein